MRRDPAAVPGRQLSADGQDDAPPTIAVVPFFGIFLGLGGFFLGLALVILAGCLAVAGASFVVGREQQLYELTLARPGVALIPLGAIAAAMGSPSVLGGRDWSGSVSQFLASVPQRIGAGLLLLLGLALVGAGLFEVISPAAFDKTIESAFAPFGGPPWASR